MPDHERGNPIHCAACRADVAWSTINAGEAIPGVVTPLTWSFFGDATERAMKATSARATPRPRSGPAIGCGSTARAVR
jgi:hypothetical protein